MFGNIFAVGQMSSLLLSTERVLDVSILLEDIGNNHIPVEVRIFW